MGKRKQRPTPAGPKAVWEIEDKLALFSILDFCIKYNHVFPFSEENVVGRFHDVGSTHNDYTWAQINRKLKKMWGDFGLNSSSNIADVYVEGSACFDLAENERGAIEEQVKRLEKLLKPSSLRKNALRVPVSRKASSASPLTTKEDQSHTPECNTGDRERLTPRAQRHRTRELAKQSKWEWETPEGNLWDDETPRKKIQHIKNGLRDDSDQAGKKTSEDLEKERERLLADQPALAEEQLELSNKNMEDNKVSNALALEDQVPSRVAPLRLGSEIRKSQGDPVPSPTTLERMHRSELRKKDEEIIELQETVRAYEERFADYQTQLDSFGSVQETRQEGGDAVELLVSNLNREIRHLKKAKEDCRKIGSFTKLAGSYDTAREEMHMETRVPIMRRLMKNVLGSCDDDTMLKIPGPKISRGLRTLLSFAMGLEFDEQKIAEKERFESLLSNRPPYSIIETLIEAAVCMWVLESNFPNFEQDDGRLSLLAKYRELITTQDGAVALRNLELASHHTLINSPRFHQLIRKEAEDLATSLSKTLAPFFARNVEESEKNVFETWGEEESVWKARRQRLVTIFKDALKMKADSLLTPERYELVCYAPGTAFDPACMDVETIDGAPVDAPDGEDYLVEHCLHVAILAFTREKVKSADPISDAKIQYKNFTRGDATRVSDAMEPTVLVKAVVVLRKQDGHDAHSDRTVEETPEAV